MFPEGKLSGRAGMASRKTIGLLGYEKRVLQCSFTVNTLPLFLHLPVIKICLFILVLQAEEAVGAAGRYQLHGKMVPEAPPNHGAWFAYESRGQEVRCSGDANPQQGESRVTPGEPHPWVIDADGGYNFQIWGTPTLKVANFCPCDIIYLVTSERSYELA